MSFVVLLADYVFCLLGEVGLVGISTVTAFGSLSWHYVASFLRFYLIFHGNNIGRKQKNSNVKSSYSETAIC